jgi:hypothetical protein
MAAAGHEHEHDATQFWIIHENLSELIKEKYVSPFAVCEKCSDECDFNEYDKVSEEDFLVAIVMKS